MKQFKSVVWSWDGVILFLLNFVINSFPRLSDFTELIAGLKKFEVFN